jgi:NADPH:quinone reductase-like Zn-dependent oxidoreductase
MEAGFAEYAVVHSRRLLPVPAPAPEVVALLTSGLTASLALTEAGGLRLPGFGSSSSGGGGGQRQQQQQQGPEQRKQATVLVTAAAGGTGQFAVQLAKLAGCHVVATCGGASKARLLQQLGVDRVIDYK